MDLPEEILERLACPKCKGNLDLAGDQGAFHCNACRLAYAIEDGIPNFLIEDACPLDGSSSEG